MYTATLMVGGESQSQRFEVRVDPRTRTSPQDLVAQHEFLLDLGGIINRLADRTADLMSVKEQVTNLAGLTDEAGLTDDDQARVQTAADSLTGNLTGLQEEIQQTENTSFYDPLDNPGKLAAELAFLYNTVSGSLGGFVNERPTDQAIDRLEELRAEVGGVLGRLQAVFDEDLAAFNDLIRSLGMDPVVLKREGLIS
jgi:hypothetical protein